MTAPMPDPVTRSPLALRGAGKNAMHPQREREAGLIGSGLHAGALFIADADAEDLAAGYAFGRGPAGASLAGHGSQDIRPRNDLTWPMVTGHNIGMTTTRTSYQTGDAIEVNRPDFTTPGFPAAWFAGVVVSVDPIGDKGHVDLGISIDGVVTREVVGPRGGNRNVRRPA